MDCPQCEAASKAEWHGFTNGCQGCAARAVARGPDFRRVRDLGAQDRRYRDALLAMRVTHDQVKAAAQADALSRTAA